MAEAEARGEVPVEQAPGELAAEPDVEELPPVAAAADEPVAPSRTEPLGDAEEAAAAQATQTTRSTETAEADGTA
jgi:hypothetical protein